MDSRRQLKMGSVIQEAFTNILNREGKSIYGKAFVTLTRVKVTSDLGLVRFYLSVYNSEDADAVVDSFYTHKHELKRKLNEQMRHQLRIMPEIEFFKDDTLDYAFHMDEVFKKIKEEDALLTEDRRRRTEEEKPKRKTTRKTKKK